MTTVVKQKNQGISSWLQDFMKRDSSSGVLLVITAVIAMAVENSPLKWLYDMLLNTPVEIRVGALQLAKPLLLWINDGLMAMFFLLVGSVLSAVAGYLVLRFINPAETRPPS